MEFERLPVNRSSQQVSPPRKRRIQARALASFIPQLTRKAFEKHGFATAALLADWDKVVGQEVASCSIPERLKWPRAAGSGEEAEVRAGATLVLRVDGPRAIELQHASPQIIERINAYFGYRAVAGLRFVQGPIVRRECATPRGKPLPRSAPSLPALEAMPDERLRAALTHLYANITAERQRRT
jgi:hypothetical protein